MPVEDVAAGGVEGERLEVVEELLPRPRGSVVSL